MQCGDGVMLAAGDSPATVVCSTCQNCWEALGWAKKVRSRHSMGRGATLSSNPLTPLKLPLPGGSRSCDLRSPNPPHVQAEKQLCESGDPFPKPPALQPLARDAESCSDAERGARASLPPTVSPTPPWPKCRTLSLSGRSPSHLDVPLGPGQAPGDRRGWEPAAPSPVWQQHRDSRSLPRRAKNRLQLRSWC